MPDLAAARQAKSRIMDSVLSAVDTRHVAGIGLRQQDDGWVVRVNLREDDDNTRRKIPSEIEGVPVVVEVTGSIRAHAVSGTVLQVQPAEPSSPRHRHLRLWLAVALLVVAAGAATTLAVML
ncbi:hypothetical protein OHB05_42660 [Streptomyces sp. NBC_00638]|uniref:hypothetical protein n=1 Tax=Streptomyces sp. NBC_00638 TaxID=2975794 RepID=UPI0022504053|nr:hypothetical protein [Streptomyces sp. NBC_00638]MCX5009220.1 hypothetical protein [Streptomyces sp. NBC_00638]